jgi:hypothetical protein
VKVIKVAENVITYSYPSENAVNEIKSDGIDKIVFASGRTQNFNGSVIPESEANVTLTEKAEVPMMEEAAKKPEYAENTIAILPLEFEKNGDYNKDLANGATAFFASLVRVKAENNGIKVLRLDKAIEKLLDAGIGYDKLRESSPAQLRKALGTEYILYVSIKEMDKDSTITNTASSTNTVADSDSDFMSDTDTNIEDTDISKAKSSEISNNMHMERLINLRLYGAESDEEAYEQDFSDQVLIAKTGNDPGSLEAGSDKWKPSLQYITDELFASNLFKKSE